MLMPRKEERVKERKEGKKRPAIAAIGEGWTGGIPSSDRVVRAAPSRGRGKVRECRGGRDEGGVAILFLILGSHYEKGERPIFRACPSPKKEKQQSCMKKKEGRGGGGGGIALYRRRLRAVAEEEGNKRSAYMDAPFRSRPEKGTTQKEKKEKCYAPRLYRV